MAFTNLLNFDVQAIDSEQPILEEFSQQLPDDVGVLLVDGDKQTFTYRAHLADVSEQINFAEMSINETISLLLDLPAQPVKSHIVQIGLADLAKPEDVLWVLPLPYRQALSRWIILLDANHRLQQAEVESLYYKLGWSLTSLQLHLHSKRLTKANEWIDLELKEMTRVQQLMLPDPEDVIPGAEIAFTYRALKGAGGDYLDIVSLEDDKSSTEPHQMGVIVADVTGHGPSAAVEAAMLDAILRTFRPDDKSSGPAEVFNYINQHFFTRKERGSFLTASIFRYCPETKMIAYANAGHPHAYLKRGSHLIPLDEGGIPIGVSRDYGWDSYQVPVQKGDTIFVYTDVVIETKNPHMEDFGFSRLEDVLRSADNNPQKLLAYIESRLKAFCHCRQYNDDMTMCAVQFTD